MTVKQRIRMCLMIEKMMAHKNFCEKLGVEDRSTLCGKRLDGKEGKQHVDHIIQFVNVHDLWKDSYVCNQGCMGSI